MRKDIMIIPIMTLFANIAVWTDIPIFREIVVFVFLSFIPGFAVLRLFKLKETSFLDIFLFSVALSIALVMFMGLLVNELYLFLGLSQPLSTIPLIAAISAFTLSVFFIEYRRNFSETLKLKIGFEDKLRNIILSSTILFLLPLLGALGVLYLDVSVILLSCAIIAALCVMSVVSRRLIPENLFPFVIFSISIALICQGLLISKYIVGYDANFEYYVFRLTQTTGHWGFLDASVNQLAVLSFDSMLSITLLPAVYSVLMQAHGEAVFKILYPFIFSLIPLTLYRTCEKQFGKLIGLLAALFFVFTSTALYGPEPLSLNRQIVGELFFTLSVFLLTSKTIPVTKRRLLLIIFGAALAVSHYTLAYVYLGIVAVVFIISRVKPRFDDTFNTATVLLLFLMTISWYTLGPRSPLLSLTNTVERTFIELTTGLLPYNLRPVTATSTVFATPKVFTAASWINLLLSGIANLFLIIGVLSIILRPKRTEISAKYSVMSIIAAVIMVASLVSQSIAVALNFTRFYAITLLFLSPCFALGGQMLLAIIEKAWTKIKRPLKPQIAAKSKNRDLVLLLVAILLSAYFLSQVGFVNRVTNGSIHSYTIDFDRMTMSNESEVKTVFYGVYIPEQDVVSASWLQSHKAETTEVFADYLSETHALVSYGLIPANLLLPATNKTIPPQGSFVYLGSLNIVDGVMTTAIGSFNTSEISLVLDQNNLIYSNGNSEIWTKG